MAEQGSKAFGQYTGQRVSPVPEGFLSAYAQIAKNYQGIGEDLGKGVGSLIADYRASRAAEDAYNQKTSSPEFLTGLSKAMAGAREKQDGIKAHFQKIGWDPELEDDPSDPQHPSNLEALKTDPNGIAEGSAILAAYDNVHSLGASFLKDPSKFDNKKKAQLIGMVGTALDSMNAESKATADATAAGLKTRATMADITSKDLAAAAARAPAYTPSTAVRDVIGLATTMSPEQAQGQFLALLKQAEIEAELDRANGGGGSPTQQTGAKLIALRGYVQSLADPSNVQAGAPLVQGDPFISVEEAQARLKSIDKQLENPNHPKFDLLNAQRTELREGLENAEMDKSDKLYAPEAVGLIPDERIVENNRRFQMALNQIENLNGIQTKNGKLMLPTLSIEDRKNLYRVIELGGLGIRSAEDGVLYDVDDNGIITTKPLTEAEINDAFKRLEGPMDPKTRAAIVKADTAEAKFKANIGSRNFGEFEVSTRSVPDGPDGKTETVSVVNTKRGERLLFVPSRPDLQLWISGKMNTDGTPSSKNVQEFRTTMAEQNELLNSLESARDVLHYTPAEARALKLPNPDSVRHKKETLTENDMVIYLQRLYSMKRAMGKGLGPLSKGDYQLLETNVFAQVPYSTINFEENNVIKQFLNKEWKNVTRDVPTMENQLYGIQKDVMNRALGIIKSGSSVWAVNDNEERVDDGFTVSHGLLTDNDGKITTKHLYLATKDGKAEYQIFDARLTIKGYYGEPKERKTTHEQFENVMKDQYTNNKLLREKYLYLLSALQRQNNPRYNDAGSPDPIARKKDVEIGRAMLQERLEYVGMPAVLIKLYIEGIVEGL